jgi:hypothetical protein
MKNCLICECENEDDATKCSQCGKAAFREDLLTPPPGAPSRLKARLAIAAGVFVAVSGLSYYVANLRLPEGAVKPPIVIVECLGCGMLAALSTFLTARPPRLERGALISLAIMLAVIALSAIVAAVSMAILDLQMSHHH